MAAKIRKNDQVIVLSGKSKGQKGRVMSVNPRRNMAVVQGVNLVTRHVRPTQYKEGQIERREALIGLSKIALVDPKTGKPTRVGFEIRDNVKVRVAKRSGEVIDG